MLTLPDTGNNLTPKYGTFSFIIIHRYKREYCLIDSPRRNCPTITRPLHLQVPIILWV